MSTPIVQASIQCHFENEHVIGNSNRYQYYAVNPTCYQCPSCGRQYCEDCHDDFLPDQDLPEVSRDQLKSTSDICLLCYGEKYHRPVVFQEETGGYLIDAIPTELDTEIERTYWITHTSKPGPENLIGFVCLVGHDKWMVWNIVSGGDDERVSNGGLLYFPSREAAGIACSKQGQSLIAQHVDGRKNSYQTRSNAMPVLHILKDSRDFVTESDQVIHLSDDTPIALAAVPGLAGRPAVDTFIVQCE
jgi:hypothetical protein